MSELSSRAPALAAAWDLLVAARHPERKIRHSLAVAVSGLRLALALENAGQSVDADLTLNGGLLHDISHGDPEHATAGALLILGQGWVETAHVVGGHTELPPEVLLWLGVTERDCGYTQALLPPVRPDRLALVRLASVCVYLADKYCLGDQAVSIAERFANIRAFCRRQGVREGIETRQRVAEAVESRLGEICGADPLAVIQRPSGHPHEAVISGMLRGFEALLASGQGYSPAKARRPSTSSPAALKCSRY